MEPRQTRSQSKRDKEMNGRVPLGNIANQNTVRAATPQSRKRNGDPQLPIEVFFLKFVIIVHLFCFHQKPFVFD
jgi:hypothetical protein